MLRYVISVRTFSVNSRPRGPAAIRMSRLWSPPWFHRWVLLLQRAGQLEHLRRGPRLRLPRRRDQRVEPALPVVEDPPVQRPAGDPDRAAARIGMRAGRELAHQRAPLT